MTPPLLLPTARTRGAPPSSQTGPYPCSNGCGELPRPPPTPLGWSCQPGMVSAPLEWSAPVRGALRYSAILYAVIFSNYHPCWRRGGSFFNVTIPPLHPDPVLLRQRESDARVASTSFPTFPARCWWSEFRLSQTFLPISQTRHWSLWGYCRSATLVSSRHYVSAEIQLFHHFYLGSGLGVAQRK